MSARRSDPTHGRIDQDIQEQVEAMNPRTLGQRVAMENTLQERRDQSAPSGRPPRPQHARDSVRWHVGWHLATPFYAAERIGKRLGSVGARIVRWSERTSSHVCDRGAVEQTPGYGRCIVRCPVCHRPGVRTFRDGQPRPATWSDEISPASPGRL